MPMTDTPAAEDTVEDTAEPALVQQPRLWQDETWTAKVIKNEDDDGWAVAMTRRGEAEAALVGPWTMGRDKKTPKPLDAPAFFTLVKTASEVLRRHEQQLHAQLHKSVKVTAAAGTFLVTLDIVPSEDEAYAVLAAQDATGTEQAIYNNLVRFLLAGSQRGLRVRINYVWITLTCNLQSCIIFSCSSIQLLLQISTLTF